MGKNFCHLVLARKYPPTIIAGNAVEKLPEILSSVPQNVALCIFHTFALNQFSSDSSEKLFSLLAQHSLKQDVFVVSIEVKDKANPLLKITFFKRGIKSSQTLAYCSPHGDWLEWLLPEVNEEQKD